MRVAASVPTRARLCAAALASLLGVALGRTPAGAQARPETAAASQPFVVEYYYKVRWGAQEEFWQLFRKNTCRSLRLSGSWVSFARSAWTVPASTCPRTPAGTTG
jgi:phage-related minor tail protein